jgi:hypothetical protein
MKIRFAVGRLDGNHHGPKTTTGDFATLRSCLSIVPLGRSMWLLREGRRLIGRRLWVYGPSGACVNFDVMLVFDRSPYRPPSPYAPRGDAPTLML